MNSFILRIAKVAVFAIAEKVVVKVIDSLDKKSNKKVSK